ncbi:hypothetical protein [Leptospira idonii]|uniref:Uncharacterized protein n=1 Tax=Leptospira idonii TaxID=1193500 RepID=A0A4R9M0C4_9LEPT|nr:hypothetical protein [Leptospira idonii]TGN18148.1 hypothetical protein EHS15_12080 [Leptospira idonii]
MKYLLFFVLSLIGCVSSFKKHTPILAVGVDLPQSLEWQLASDKSAGGEYLKEWIPVSNNVANTEWIIVEQKFNNTSSAHSFIQSVFALAKSQCTNILYNGPDRKDIGESESYVGRLMCAQQIGKEYGTFTEMRVLSDGLHIFVITSERRFPPTQKAGQFEFRTPEEIIAFNKKISESALFVRNSITVCTANCS